MFKLIVICFFSISPLTLSAQSGSYTYETIEQHRNFQQFVEVEGGKMAYVDYGKGQPILLVHGVPSSSWLYRFMIDSLARCGYRVIAPDLLGYGNSDKPKGYDIYNAKKQGERLLTLMDSLNIDKWTHAMHDAGGIWTWELMQKAQGRINHLIIFNTIAYQEGFKPPMRFSRGGIARFYTNMYRWPLTQKMMIGMTFSNGMSSKKLSKEEKRGYCLPMKEGGNRALYHFFTNLGKKKLGKKLETYQKAFLSKQIPTLIVWGKKDDILIGKKQVPLLCESMKINMKNVHILEKAKHFVQEEEPHFICSLIHSFLRGQKQNY